MNGGAPAAALAALAVVLASSCVTAGEGRKIWAETRALRAQGEEAQRLARELRERLDAIGRRLEDLARDVRSTAAEVRRDVGQLQAEASRIGGRLDEVERGTDLNRRELELIREEERRRRAAFGTTPSEKKLLEDPETAYFAAVKEFSRGRLGKAIDLFTATLERHPQHPRREAIYFGIAEAYLTKQDYRRALVEFERFYLDFGQSSRSAEALLRIAECHQALGNRRKAVLALRLLRQKFKDSPFAVEAAKMLRRP